MKIRKKAKKQFSSFFISLILSISLIAVQNSNVAFATIGSVILDSGSVSDAVQGNGKVTGLTSSTQYIVTSDEVTKYVQADGSLSDTAADIADLTGTEITGLTNGKTYLVQKYEDTFADWQIYSHTGNWGEDPFPNGDQNPSGGQNNNHIILKDNGDRVTFYGYGSPAYKDFMYLPNNTPSKKTFAFQLDQAGINYHSMEGGGFLFNTKIEDGLLSGYSIIFAETGIKLFELNNVDVDSFHESQTQFMDGSLYSMYGSGYQCEGVTLLDTFTQEAGTVHSIKIEAAPSKVSMWDGETKVINDYALTNKYGNGIGLIASYAAHGCNILSYFTYTKLQVEGINVRWPILDLSAQLVGDDKANLTFTAPTTASAVSVQQSTDGINYTDATLESSIAADANNATVTGLTKGQMYYFKLKVTGGINAGYSNVATITWPISDLVATPGDEQANLTFTAPKNASSVTLQLSTDGTNYYNFNQLTTTTTNALVSYLTNGQKYYFRLSVVGGDNAGYSNVVTVTPMVAAPPESPIDAKLIKGVGGRSTIKFTPPTNDGGSQITGYVVTINPGNITVSGKGSPIMLTGLKSGVNYTFKVKAVNAAGDSVDVDVEK